MIENDLKVKLQEIVIITSLSLCLISFWSFMSELCCIFTQLKTKLILVSSSNVNTESYSRKHRETQTDTPVTPEFWTHTHSAGLSVVILQWHSSLSAVMFKLQLRLVLFLYLLSIKIRSISDLQIMSVLHMVPVATVRRASFRHRSSGCRAEKTMIVHVCNLMLIYKAYFTKVFFVSIVTLQLCIRFYIVNKQNDPTLT